MPVAILGASIARNHEVKLGPADKRHCNCARGDCARQHDHECQTAVFEAALPGNYVAHELIKLVKPDVKKERREMTIQGMAGPGVPIKPDKKKNVAVTVEEIRREGGTGFQTGVHRVKPSNPLPAGEYVSSSTTFISASAWTGRSSDVQLSPVRCCGWRCTTSSRESSERPTLPSATRGRGSECPLPSPSPPTGAREFRAVGPSY